MAPPLFARVCRVSNRIAKNIHDSNSFDSAGRIAAVVSATPRCSSVMDPMPSTSSSAMTDRVGLAPMWRRAGGGACSRRRIRRGATSGCDEPETSQYLARLHRPGRDFEVEQARLLSAPTLNQLLIRGGARLFRYAWPNPGFGGQHSSPGGSGFLKKKCVVGNVGCGVGVAVLAGCDLPKSGDQRCQIDKQQKECVL